ncbi:MAG: transcription termination factor Rho [Pseudomonadota bacterium]
MDEEVKEQISEETRKMPDFKKPLDKMTVIELKEVGKEIPGLTGVHAMKKADLLAVIKEYYGIEDEGEKKEKKKAGKLIASVKDLKSEIVHLREKRDEARARSDRKKIDLLRRRINRLKKRTRKVAQG